jgi:dTDP-4-dehydrorhamnose 3,5-epimerase
MKAIGTALPEIVLFEPRVYGDERGFFLETYNKRVLSDFGVTDEFVQDNHSRSVKNVLRGLHYQVERPQGKLVRVVMGEVFDVAVDVRRRSPSFGKWVGFTLSAVNRTIAWIPPGFAHGFLVQSEVAEVLYKTTDYYAPTHERSLLWNDPDIGIVWPLFGEPILSAKDRAATRLRNAEVFS